MDPAVPKVNSPLSKTISYFISLTSVSSCSPRLFRHTRPPDNRSPSRLEGIHVGVLKFAGGFTGEMLLSRLLMGRMESCCLRVHSGIPEFTPERGRVDQRQTLHSRHTGHNKTLGSCTFQGRFSFFSIKGNILD